MLANLGLTTTLSTVAFGAVMFCSGVGAHVVWLKAKARHGRR